MKKLRIIDFVLIASLVGLSLFVFTSKDKSPKTRAIPNVNIGTSANDHTGDPLRTAFGKVNQVIDAINGGIDASTIFQAIADSVNGYYATKDFVLLHTNGGTSWVDSLPYLANPPASGNAYINSGDKKLHWKANGYWHWVKRTSVDSTGYSSYYGSELIDNGAFAAVGDWVIQGDQAEITSGTLVINGSAWGTIGEQAIAISIVKTYKIEFDIVSYTSGKLRLGLGDYDFMNTNNIDYSGTQHVAFNLEFDNSPAPAGIIFFSYDVGFVGVIDNVSVMEVL